jgi:hypothetical protein
MMANDRTWTCFVIVALCIAVGPIVSQSGAAPAQVEQTQSSRDPDAAASRLIAAAEPFEALTEQVFSAQPKKLDSNIAAAEKAVEQARSARPSGVASELDQRLAEIRSARRSNDRSRLALASVEGYRLLVSAAPQTKVPTAVSLLDYAGFRYDADVKSRPIRWSDMAAAVEFANRQWDSISARITDPALENKFSATLQQMHAAIARKAAIEAKKAVKTELDLVDKLEEHFNQK